MQAWGSNEVTWRRLRRSSTETKRQQSRPDLTVPQAVQFAEARLGKQSRKAQRTVFNSDDEEPENTSRISAELRRLLGIGHSITGSVRRLLARPCDSFNEMASST